MGEETNSVRVKFSVPDFIRGRGRKSLRQDLPSDSNVILCDIFLTIVCMLTKDSA